MTVEYEWVIESLEGPDTDDGVEILDVTHADTYAEALKFAAQFKHSRIGLARDTDDDRAWAYVENGELASHCEDAFGRQVAPVPKRFRQQFERGA